MKWNKKYESCVECGTKFTPYKAKGMCSKCYAKSIRKFDRCECGASKLTQSKHCTSCASKKNSVRNKKTETIDKNEGLKPHQLRRQSKSYEEIAAESNKIWGKELYTTNKSYLV